MSGGYFDSGWQGDGETCGVCGRVMTDGPCACAAKVRKPRFTVYECDRAGTPWDICTTDDPALALARLNAGRALRPRNAFGVFETDEPERGDCTILLEELVQEEER